MVPIPEQTPFPPFQQPLPSENVFPVNDGKHHTLTGNFRKHERFHSNFLTEDRDVLVYLPPGYEEDPQQRYPVLYLNDGQNVFDGATSFVPGQEWHVDETAEWLIRERKVRPLIIVGVYNTGRQRMDEYTPTRDRRSGSGGKAGRYGRMLVEELKPFIDRCYRTVHDASHTALGGSSLGGLVSLYVALKNPKTFGKVAVMSPSVWWDRKSIIREVKGIRKRPDLKIWLDIGTAEGNRPDRIVSDVRDLRDALVRKGWKEASDLAYMEAEGAGHNEGAWASRIGRVLEFLFPAQQQ